MCLCVVQLRILVVLSCFCLFIISFSLLLALVWFLVLILVFLDIFPLFVVVSVFLCLNVAVGVKDSVVGQGETGVAQRLFCVSVLCRRLIWPRRGARRPEVP